jgi:hypothetical protein
LNLRILRLFQQAAKLLFLVIFSESAQTEFSNLLKKASRPANSKPNEMSSCIASAVPRDRAKMPPGVPVANLATID